MRTLFLSALGFSLAAHGAIAMAIPRAHAGSLAPAAVAEVTVDLVAEPPPPVPDVTPTPVQHAVTYVASARRAVVSPMSRHQDVAPPPPASAPGALAVASAALPRFSLVVGSAETTGGVVITGGVGQGTPTAAPAAAVDTLDDKGVSVPAYLVSSGRPEYPSEARAAGIEGDVPLEIVVDQGGRVVEASLLRRAGHGFDESALRAIRSYRFAPAQRDGVAVRVRMRWTVAFRLE
jgi:TonB family protein